MIKIKKLFANLMLVLLVVAAPFVLFACNDYKEPISFLADSNLIEKNDVSNDVSFEANIWNDNMPYTDTSKSVHYIQITTQKELSNELSVEILTSNKHFFRTFAVTNNGEKTPWGAYDFRATTNFRLDDGEKWTMNVSFEFDNEIQTVTLTGKVFVTW